MGRRGGGPGSGCGVAYWYPTNSRFTLGDIANTISITDRGRIGPPRRPRASARDFTHTGRHYVPSQARRGAAAGPSLAVGTLARTRSPRGTLRGGFFTVSRN